MDTDHPVDELPEYARGESPDAVEIERHLAGCETCRLELEVVRALAGPLEVSLSDVERARLFRDIEARRGGAGVAGPAWLRTAWRAAAGIALLLTSAGVWQIVQGGSTPDWDPDAAIDGWAQDLADIDLSAGELRIALGVGLIDDPALDLPFGGLQEYDVGEVVMPWEEDR